MSTVLRLLLAVVVLGVLNGAEGYSSGAPKQACSTMTPGHDPSPNNIEGGQRPYVLQVPSKLQPGERTTIRLSGGSFQGFMVRVLDGRGNSGGTFQASSSGDWAAMSCQKDADTATHRKHGSPYTSVDLSWKAPSQPGVYRVMATIVEEYSTFYTGYYSDVTVGEGSSSTSTAQETSSLSNQLRPVRHQGSTTSSIHQGLTSGNVHQPVRSNSFHHGLQSTGLQHGLTASGLQHGLSSSGIHQGLSSTGLQQHGLSSVGLQHGLTSSGLQHGLTSNGIHHGLTSGGFQQGYQSHTPQQSLHIQALHQQALRQQALYNQALRQQAIQQQAFQRPNVFKRTPAAQIPFSPGFNQRFLPRRQQAFNRRRFQG